MLVPLDIACSMVVCEKNVISKFTGYQMDLSENKLMNEIEFIHNLAGPFSSVLILIDATLEDMKANPKSGSNEIKRLEKAVASSKALNCFFKYDVKSLRNLREKK